MHVMGQNFALQRIAGVKAVFGARNVAAAELRKMGGLEGDGRRRTAEN